MAELDTTLRGDSNQQLKRNPSNPRDFFAKIYETTNTSNKPSENYDLDKGQLFRKGKSPENVDDIKQQERSPFHCDHEQNSEIIDYADEETYSVISESEKSGIEDVSSCNSGQNEDFQCEKSENPAGATGDEASKMLFASSPVLTNRFWAMQSSSTGGSAVTSAGAAAALTGIQWSLLQHISGSSGEVNVPPAFSSYRKYYKFNLKYRLKVTKEVCFY